MGNERGNGGAVVGPPPEAGGDAAERSATDATGLTPRIVAVRRSPDAAGGVDAATVRALRWTMIRPQPDAASADT